MFSLHEGSPCIIPILVPGSLKQLFSPAYWLNTFKANKQEIKCPKGAGLWQIRLMFSHISFAYFYHQLWLYSGEIMSARIQKLVCQRFSRGSSLDNVLGWDFLHNEKQYYGLQRSSPNHAPFGPAPKVFLHISNMAVAVQGTASYKVMFKEKKDKPFLLQRVLLCGSSGLFESDQPS